MVWALIRTLYAPRECEIRSTELAPALLAAGMAQRQPETAEGAPLSLVPARSGLGSGSEAPGRWACGLAWTSARRSEWGAGRRQASKRVSTRRSPRRVGGRLAGRGGWENMGSKSNISNLCGRRRGGWAQPQGWGRAGRSSSKRVWRARQACRCALVRPAQSTGGLESPRPRHQAGAGLLTHTRPAGTRCGPARARTPWLGPGAQAVTTDDSNPRRLGDTN